jgi:hypothetical protein
MGTFQSAVLTNLGMSITSVVVPDVNGDGKQDFLGLNSSGGGLVIFLGNGNGTFTPGASYPVVGGGVPTLGDFNGDGKVDLVLVGASTQTLLGNGDGTFQPAITSPGVTSGFPAAVGDFNGDGKLDLVVGSSSGQLFLSFGNGNGTFQTPMSSLSLSADQSGPFFATDLNGDHKLDLMIGLGRFVQIFLGNGDGTFVLKDSYLHNGAGVVADFNRDGKPDLALDNVILLGNGDGTFQGNVGSLIGTTGGPGALGDFNQDGKPDGSSQISMGWRHCSIRAARRQPVSWSLPPHFHPAQLLPATPPQPP